MVKLEGECSEKMWSKWSEKQSEKVGRESGVRKCGEEKEREIRLRR